MSKVYDYTVNTDTIDTVDTIEQPGYKFVDDVVPFPKYYHGLKTTLHVFNELPVVDDDNEFVADLPKYIVREDKELDFWNEIRGFFVANENNGVIVHDIPKFELPTEDGVYYIDATEKDLDSIIGWAYNPVVGDRIIMPDYKVYTVIGFNNSSYAGGGACISFDVQ